MGPDAPRTSVHRDRGVAAIDDLALLPVAAIAFSVFFAALAGALTAQQERERGERLEALAGSLVAAAVDDARWTRGHGLLDAAALDRATAADFRPLAAAQPFEVVIRDLSTGERWTFAEGAHGSTSRTAATGANVLGTRTDPARVVATVWGP